MFIYSFVFVLLAAINPVYAIDESNYTSTEVYYNGSNPWHTDGSVWHYSETKTSDLFTVPAGAIIKYKMATESEATANSSTSPTTISLYNSAGTLLQTVSGQAGQGYFKESPSSSGSYYVKIVFDVIGDSFWSNEGQYWGCNYNTYKQAWVYVLKPNTPVIASSGNLPKI